MKRKEAKISNVDDIILEINRKRIQRTEKRINLTISQMLCCPAADMNLVWLQFNFTMRLQSTISNAVTTLYHIH